jgi:hypothetical protein
MKRLLIIALLLSCSDGPDLIGPPAPAAVTSAGCALPDAGPPDTAELCGNEQGLVGCP